VAGAYTLGAAASRTMVRATMPAMASLYDFEATSLDGKKMPMSAYKGKPVLILNVASL
jgi:hypothetical protein